MVYNIWHTFDSCVMWEYTCSYNELRAIKINFCPDSMIHMLAHTKDFILFLQLGLKKVLYSFLLTFFLSTVLRFKKCKQFFIDMKAQIFLRQIKSVKCFMFTAITEKQAFIFKMTAVGLCMHLQSTLLFQEKNKIKKQSLCT